MNQVKSGEVDAGVSGAQAQLNVMINQFGVALDGEPMTLDDLKTMILEG